MTKIRVACVVLAVVLFSLSSATLAGGVEAVFYEAGTMAVGMFTNTVGAAVTGLHIEFDCKVTIVNKVEFGGYLPLLGELTGTAFDFAGGGLVASGTVELDWEPVEARPSLVQWISGTAPVGTPYFTSIEVLGRLLGEGIVMVREANPELLAAAFEQFFATNAEFFGALEESLGISLQESLMPIIMAAPAEAIANFFNTIIGMLGVTTLDEVLQGDVDFSALFALLGL